MSPDLQAGVTFEWRYTIPERVAILPERFNAKPAQKKAQIAS